MINVTSGCASAAPKVRAELDTALGKALPNAVSSSALTLGAALAQPLVTLIMVYWGWRASFYVFVPAGIAAFALWWWYARDYPNEHPAMTPGELETISANRSAERLAEMVSSSPGVIAGCSFG